MTQTPDTVLALNDPGDDTQHRFRYQAVCASRYILSLFDDEAGIEEVFCEQHEDILVKYSDGRFRGVQIKTKSEGSIPFKATDVVVTAAVKKFIEEEKQFPGHFVGFTLAANCGFWDEDKNGSNLGFILTQTTGATVATMTSVVKRYLCKLCPPVDVRKRRKKGSSEATGTGADSSQDTCAGPPEPSEPYDQQLDRGLGVLQKLHLDHTPSLNRPDWDLVHALANSPAVGANHTIDALMMVAEVLIAEVLKASTREIDSAKQHYFGVLRDPSGQETAVQIAAKRFDRDRAKATLTRGLSTRPTSPPGPFNVGALPPGTRRQEAKMAAGEIVLSDILEALQQRHAAEYAIAVWIAKEGISAADPKYQDVVSAVLTECRLARTAAEQQGRPYGQSMLALVRQRMENLHRQGLHGLRYDQLLGIAGILTEECRLWWSDAFEVAERTET